MAHRAIGKGGISDELMAPYSSWNIPGEPYSRGENTRFHWFRSRAVGGRTNHWGQAAMRFSDRDFYPYSSTGVGTDWPIGYKDLVPYYDKIEGCVGIFGTNANSGNGTGSTYLPAPKPRCTELLIKKGCGRLGLPCVPSHLAILTRDFHGRQACHYYCGQCYRGCKTSSCFSSSQVLLPSAFATGKLKLFTESMASEVLVGSDGNVLGVSYIDKPTGVTRQILARIVIIAASACESARLLLNSQSKLFPDGLANSSGVVGKYLMDSVGSAGEAYFPSLEKMQPHNHDGTGGMHVFIPRSSATESSEFAGGYHIEFGGGRRMPSVAEFNGPCDEFEGFGMALKQECRRRYGNSISFLCMGDTVVMEV